MRVLLDECLPRKLKRELPGHEVRSAPELGWARLKDAELLRRVEDDFDVFVTADGSLPYQQNLTRLRLAIVVLRARSTRLATLLPLMPELRRRLPSLRAGHVLEIGEP